MENTLRAVYESIASEIERLGSGFLARRCSNQRSNHESRSAANDRQPEIAEGVGDITMYASTAWHILAGARSATPQGPARFPQTVWREGAFPAVGIARGPTIKVSSLAGKETSQRSFEPRSRISSYARIGSDAADEIFGAASSPPSGDSRAWPDRPAARQNRVLRLPVVTTFGSRGTEKRSESVADAQAGRSKGPEGSAELVIRLHGRPAGGQRNAAKHPARDWDQSAAARRRRGSDKMRSATGRISMNSATTGRHSGRGVKAAPRRRAILVRTIDGIGTSRRKTVSPRDRADVTGPQRSKKGDAQGVMAARKVRSIRAAAAQQPRPKSCRAVNSTPAGRVGGLRG